MKILLNLAKVLLIILVLFVLTQNADQFVDIDFFTYHFSQVNLYIVIIVCLALGALLGGLFMAFYAVQLNTEMRQLKRKNRQLTQELDNLRNISIEDIPEQELPGGESEKPAV